jgi:hypothetical protein
MSKERKNIKDIEIEDLVGRWDAEPNEIIERLFIHDGRTFEIIFQSGSVITGKIELNQLSPEDLPQLELMNVQGNNELLNKNSWTIWRYAGNEIDINFSDNLRIMFNLIN